ncbi:MAG: MotA/TolQ/ExbB proton channel family protein [Gammaproteobacteria bacterium]|uniref:Ferric siderophore transport system, biopolymer transport protein ExbB n=1 Tax=Marinobacter nitratireducens TaxID=1137280 RepID=A0A072MZ05_9GAMM|nr:MotA/TolQ/ExbB proton channel family protein [Marinobacter nitratireducens]KEF30624.1 Ferric siderophore transport system, biopolymer transport protein ExbB [Marinobacter nitratireducens]TNE79429.1 MAG: MotA/TolQ/ExbB proton channel family protein [Gammaproteobacteria bacterium]TNE98285.1 MAG: MotA/TolQ/ExbB proton channel family protein [Gammaproteobacteria bacterium]
MNVYTSIVSFFQEGGAFMFPIALVLMIGLAIAVERWFFLKRAYKSNRAAYSELLPLMNENKFEQAEKAAESNTAAIARLVAVGLDTMRASPRRDDIHAAMQEGVMESIPRLSKRTNYLSILANVSTLLGLLGTIIGLIAAFTAVANADPADKATLLSQSISVAMNTTAFGLIAAIPLLLIHSLLQNKTLEIVESIEMAGVKALNTIVRSNRNSVNTRASDA